MDYLIKSRQVPKQDSDLVLLLAERHNTASAALEPWAVIGKRCTEFVEGKQWTEAEIKALDLEDRPHFTINKMRPLIRIVAGYHRNNRTDIRYLPGHDGLGTDEVADALTKFSKQIDEANQVPYVSAEVFLDGLITGRGYYDWRIDYSENLNGVVKCTSKDPFAVLLDPDGSTYDLDESCSYICEDRWVSLADIKCFFGQDAYDLVQPIVDKGGYSGMPANNFFESTQDFRPWWSFGGGDYRNDPWLAMSSFLPTIFDPYRKAVRMMEFQHYIWTRRQFVVDLETGDRKAVPDNFPDEKVRKMMQWAEAVAREQGRENALRLMTMPCKRMRWTVLIGDIVAYDGWSQYQTFTMKPFFPWFRRGRTQGMAEDLIEPQQHINKWYSAQVDIVSRTPNSGWKIHKASIDDEEREKIENYGAAPGINIYWDGEPWQEPKRIEPAAIPMSLERLEVRSADNMKEISGINDSLLGIIDRVQSGVAINARQRQGVLSIQMYTDNMSRTTELNGRKKMELVQDFYTEQRMARLQGEGGKQDTIVINERLADGTIKNDVTIGIYSMAIDETPLAANFAAQQMEELLGLVEKKILPPQTVMDVAVDVSSLPQKDTIKKRVSAIMAAMGVPMEESGPASPVIYGPDGKPLPPSNGSGMPMAVPPGGPQPGQPASVPGKSLVQTNQGIIQPAQRGGLLVGAGR